MIIKILKTNCYRDESVLQDLGNFKNLESWLTAIKTGDVVFRPMNCTVRIKNERFWIVQSGQLAFNIDSTINKIKRLPARYKNLPNDDMMIVVDSFEHELDFFLNN